MNEISKTFKFDFNHPVDKLWSVVADTPRWGEASGFPKYQSTEQLQADGTIKVFGEVTIAGMKLCWEEPPANWIEGLWFEQLRLFKNGPFVSMATRAEIVDKNPQSSLSIEISFVPRNLLGYFLARRLISAFQGKVQQLLDIADQLIRAEQPDLFETDFQLSPSATERVEKAKQAIDQTQYGHGLTGKLLEYITGKQEVDLWTMRPLALARRWEVEPRFAIELFLQSVREGLLESRWDVLCPRCRVSKAKTANIGELPGKVHCDACNIDFESNFARNVELSFSPSPSVRTVEYGYYCRSGPGFTPHIKGQCTLDPGESRVLPARLSAGEYRIRTLEAGDELLFTHDSTVLPGINLLEGQLELGDSSPDGEILLRNNSPVQRTIVIEDRSWLSEVLTAERVTTMQAFRDLFSDQVLRPGDEITIRNICFLFSDLVDSTKLFADIGDAAAYQLVREHYAILGEVVREHDGTIVKTRGDGIHAAFLTPDAALLAAIEMQQSIGQFNSESSSAPITIRIGINSGSSISVNLNDRLDYYGKTVNLAARLEGQGESGDISMSRKFVEDPAVAEILQSYNLREREALFKGYSEPLTIYQITP
jgi:class 3 adenylate cyclase